MDDRTKKLLTGRAPGYWGRSPHARISAENTVDKVSRWNLDKIMAMGLPYAVWREASSVLSGLVQCSCYKDTSKQADIPCLSCYGTSSIPGYVKFGTQNYWASSIDQSWTMTNIVLDKENRPFRLMLASGATNGTATIGPLSVSTAGKIGPWEAKSDGFTRDGGANSSILVEFSVDGTAWHALNQMETYAASATQVYFKVTMARVNVNVKTPMFEIVRCRYQTMADIRGELSEPVIRVIPAWDRNAEYRSNYGDRNDSTGKRFWTMPLYFFDQSMTRETQLARLGDDVFVEVRYGGSVGTRFALLEFDYSDTFGEFTRQEFGLRQYSGSAGKIQGEFAYRVF
jgi:hypothetical protein